MSVPGKQRFFTPTVAVMVLALVALVVTAGIMSYLSVYNESVNTIRKENLALINRIQGWAAVKANQAENSAELMRLPGMTEEMIREHFAERAGAMDEVLFMIAGFPDGRMFSCDDMFTSHELHDTSRIWYALAAENPGRVSITPPYVCAATGELMFSVTRTVGDYDDSLGVVALNIPFVKGLEQLINETATPGSFSFVVKPDGSILFHTHPEFMPTSDGQFRNIADVYSNGDVIVAIYNMGVFSRDGILHVGRPMELTGWYLVTGIPASNIIRNTMPTVISLAVTAVFILAAMTFMSLMMFKMRQAADRQREANEMNKRLLESSPYIMNIWDDSSNLVSTNECAVKMFELRDTDEFIRRFYELSPEYQPCGMLSAAKVQAVLDAAYNSETPIQFEWMHQNLRREPIPTEITLARFLRGGKYFLAAYTIDLRTIRKAEEMERKAIEISEILLTSSPFALDLWDESGNVIDCNKRSLEMVGVNSHEEYLDKFFEFCPERQHDGTPSDIMILSNIELALIQGSTRFEFTRRNQHGDIIPTEATFMRTVRDNKNIIVSYTIDLRPLREAEERVKIMLDATPLAISLYDRNLNAIDCNHEAVRMFGLLQQLKFANVARSIMPQIQPDGRDSAEMLSSLVKQAFEKGTARAEFVSMRSDGTLFPSKARWVCVKLRGEDVVVEYLDDITEERAAQQREREAVSLTQLIMDSTPLCIEIWDDNLDMIYCNQKMLDISGLDTFEKYKERYLELSGNRQPNGSGSDAMLTEMLGKALRYGTARFEWAQKTFTGEEVPYECQLIRIWRGGRQEIVGYSHDVRQIRVALAKTFEADSRAALMMDASPISCIMLRDVREADGTVRIEVIDCNQAALDLFGFEDKNEVKMRLYDILPEPPAGVSMEEMLLDMASVVFRDGYDRFQLEHNHLDGTPIPCEVTVVGTEYQNSRVVVAFQNDLRPAFALLEKEKYAAEITQKFLDAAPFFIEVWNKDLELIECNNRAVEVFGLESQEDYVRMFDKLSPEFQPCGTPSDVKIRELVGECIEKGRARAEWMHLDANGEILPVDVTYVRIRRGNEYIAIGYNQDLRPIKAAIAKEREADEENKAKTRFLARMSHEVRTPMNSVMGISEIELQKNIHPQETEEAFRRIYNSSRLLLSIINDILDLSKVEAGKMEIIPAAYETASLIADTVQLNLMYIGSKQIKFSLSIDENMPMYLIGDELRIKQILNNLLSNAFKYTSEGEVSLSIEVSGTGTDAPMLNITVTDTGQGMNADQIDMLFGTEYARFNIEQNRAIEGSGLGMTIIYSLIKMMKGHISVESKPGIGTTFTVTLPQAPCGDEILGKEAIVSLKNFEITKTYFVRNVAHKREPMPYGRVLVVDDVDSNLYVVKGFLMPYKLAVETVDNARSAIELVEGGQVYDIIFMDHMMPEMNGVEATKILRGMGYHHPIVALTANATFGISNMFMDNGFSGFVSKPIDPSKMDEYLMKYIYDKQSPEVIEAARAQNNNGDAELERENGLSERLIKSFLSDAQKSLAVLEPIMQMKDMDSGALKIFTIQTHGIKSALLNISNTELAITASELESAGRSEDRLMIKKRLPKFLDDLRDVIFSLVSIKKEEGADQPEDTAYLVEQLDRMAKVLAAYDKKSAKDILAEMRKQPLSKNTRALLDQLDDYLLLSEFEEAADCARNAVNDMGKEAGR
ncbi:MAG: ATP-binding protein [Defluviitaleaceae bacterium]|nr:ATP-binding protein [Defluviitaleaceae bacterium]